MPRARRTLTIKGETLTLTEWAERTGIHIETIRSRIDHQGMSPADAISRPAATKFDPRRKKQEAMPRPCPEAKKHSSGQAAVRWSAGGRRSVRYLGKWGSREAIEAYRRFQADWVSGRIWTDGPSERGLTVASLITRYLAHVKSYYVKDGKPTSEQHGQRAALKFLLAFGAVPIADIKGKHLKECQAAMVAKGHARTTVNQNTWRIARCFRWGVGEDLVPPEIAEVLESVPNLQAGRSAAADHDPVMSVPLADVEATLPHLHADPGRRAVLEAMVRFMLAVGCRPGEMCQMTADAIDRTGAVWCYRAPNKNLHRQAKRKPRLIWIGPKAQAILAPHLDQAGENGRVWMFPPRGKKGMGIRVAITRPAFAEFVRVACQTAGVKSWYPHRLRHNRATEVQRLYEDDRAAAAVIGDTPDVARLVYADPNEAAARRIALATG